MKEKLKRFIAAVVFECYHRGILRNRIAVRTVEETVEWIVNSQDSLVRFGDGEIKLIAGKSLSFQDADEQLIQRLREILISEDEGLLVSVPDIFTDVSEYVKKSQFFWKEHLLFHRKDYERYCNKDKEYGNAFFSRPYIMYQNKTGCGSLFDQLRKIWDGRDIMIVEGKTSHNGVDNDLFDNAVSIKRIICPSTQAWSCYKKIKKECQKQDKDTLILVALGPAGKVLTQDLFRLGYRVVDIGNLDMEYSWYCMKAENKTTLKKHDVISREENEQAGYYEYLSQIIAIID